jgi:hypothetical protein
MVAAMRKSRFLALALRWLLLKLVDDHGRGVGQLVAGQAEQLFAHQFAGQEFLAAIRQFVFGVPPGLLGQVFLADAQQPLRVFGVLGRHGHKLGKGMCLSCMVCSQGAMSPRRCTLSSLLAISSVGMFLPSRASTRASAG